MAATSPLSRLASGELVGDRAPALSAAWRAFWTSRLVVWAAGTAGVLGVGTRRRTPRSATIRRIA